MLQLDPDEIYSYSKSDLRDLAFQLNEQVSVLKEIISRLEKRTDHLATELGAQNLEALFSSEKLQNLQKIVFGRSSEKRSNSDFESPLFDSSKNTGCEGSNSEGKSDSDKGKEKGKSASNSKKGSSKPKRKSSKDKVSDNVPVVEHFHYAPESKVAELGLQPWTNQFEVSDLISVVPTTVQIDRHHRQKYFYKSSITGEKNIYTAPGPVKMREGAQYSIEFTGHIAANKYAFHLPVERQVTMLRTKGLEINASSLFNQLDFAAWLLKKPLFERIVKQVKSHYVNESDDTTWNNLEDLATRTQDKYYLWGIRNEKAVCFNIYNARSQKVAKDYLGDLKGVLVTDGHHSFNILMSKELILASDWAHCRRYFVRAENNFGDEAKLFIGLIAKLFNIEEEIQGQPPDFIEKVRKEKSKPIIEKIRLALDETPHLKSSSLGKAIAYANRLWDRLIVFLTIPQVPLSTNGIERSMRTPAIGRKNHYGSKNMRTAKNAAIWYTIVETCKLNKVDSEEYIVYALKAVLQKKTLLMPWEYSTKAAQESLRSGT